MNILTPKDPAEIVPITFDFSAVLDTIASATWGISVIGGTDETPEDMFYGSPSNVGATSTHLIQGGVDGCTYLLRADVTTGGGEVFALTARMGVYALN